MSSIGGVSSPPPSYPAPTATETSSTVKLADGASKTVTRDKQGDIVSATVDPSLLRLANGNMEVTLISRDGQTTSFTTGDAPAPGGVDFTA